MKGDGGSESNLSPERTTAKQAVPPNLSAEQVAQWLSQNPGFLNARPDLLDVLEIPHGYADASSLLEAQTQRLKLRCAELESRLRDLLGNARASEDRVRALNRLTLDLLDCDEFDELVTSIYQGAEQVFGADYVSLRLLVGASSPLDAGMGEFVPDNPLIREELAPLVQGPRPVCGRLRDAQASALFSVPSARMGSAATVALGNAPAFGIFAIGSRDPDRFRPSMSTVQLRWFGRLLGRLLGPYLGEVDRSGTDRARSGR